VFYPASQRNDCRQADELSDKVAGRTVVREQVARRCGCGQAGSYDERAAGEPRNGHDYGHEQPGQEDWPARRAQGGHRSVNLASDKAIQVSGRGHAEVDADARHYGKAQVDRRRETPVLRCAGAQPAHDQRAHIAG